jgi:hypothetical protein
MGDTYRRQDDGERKARDGCVRLHLRKEFRALVNGAAINASLPRYRGFSQEHKQASTQILDMKKEEKG